MRCTSYISFGMGVDVAPPALNSILPHRDAVDYRHAGAPRRTGRRLAAASLTVGQQVLTGARIPGVSRAPVMTVLPKTQPARNDSALALVRRLLAEHGRAHAGAYALALVLMGISAAATAGSVALLRPVVNGMMDIGSPDSGGFRQLRLLAYRGRRACSCCAGSRPSGSSWCCRVPATASSPTMQARLYRHVLAQPVAFYGDRHSSELDRAAGARGERRARHRATAGHLGRARRRDPARPRGRDGLRRSADGAAGLLRHAGRRLPVRPRDPPHPQVRAPFLRRLDPHHAHHAGDRAGHPHHQILQPRGGHAGADGSSRSARSRRPPTAWPPASPCRARSRRRLAAS